MATFHILADNKPYYTIKVLFDDKEFIQTIYSEKSGDDLAEQMQVYADDYENSVRALNEAEDLPAQSDPEA
jgi:hypothetical protein